MQAATRIFSAIIFFLILACVVTLGQATPGITSISPTVGPVSPVGGPITIKGANFGSAQGTSTVTIGGISVTPTSWSGTRVVAPVPGSLGTGFFDVTVTVNGLTSNAMSFLVIPVITGDSPSEGIVGITVTLTGTSFGDQQGTSTLTFNGSPVSPLTWSNTTIALSVPAGAATGIIVATVNGFSTNGVQFSVLPAISAFQPGSAPVGGQVTILGSGFGASQGFGGVTFNGISAIVQSWSDTSIAVTVPAGAATGSVVVTTAGLRSSPGVNFGVSSPTLVSLAINPAGPVFPTNSARQFRAIGTLSDGTTSDYTSTASWASSNNFVVSVNNAAGSQGLALMKSLGTANITATIGGISGTSTVTVQTATPSITGISPAGGTVGTQVTLTGSGFGALQDSGSVLLGNRLQPVSNWSDGQVVVTVTPGSTSGTIQVLQSGLTSNSVDFIVTQPAITSVTPAGGVAGTQVTIGGSGFGATQGIGKIWMGSTYGAVVNWSDTQIVATIVPSAASGVVLVQQGGAQSNSISFSIISSISITSVSPTTGLPGVQVTVSGSGFGSTQGSGTVWLGTAYGTVVSWSDNQVVATVAAGSTSGTAQILQNGVLSNAVSFTVDVPHITSVSPTSGAAGTAVTITGSGFGSSQAGGIVWIGSAGGVVASWSDSQVQAAVAPSAVGGLVRIRQNGIWSNAFNFKVPPVFGSGPSLTISPGLISMVIGDTRTVQSLDTNGRLVTGLNWTLSDVTVATLSTDDPPIITAVAPGHATISAGNSSADLTVYAGPALPLGTVQWSVPGNGSGVSQILPAVPSDTRVDVFAPQEDGTVEAVTANGTTAWTASEPNFPALLPDFQGGLLVYSGLSIHRLDGITGRPYPSYTTQGFQQIELGFPAPHPDGTVFTVDYACSSANCPGSTDGTDAAWVVGIDSSTGQAKFKAPTVNSTAQFNNADTCGGKHGAGAGSNSVHNFPQDPIIAGDGFAYTSYTSDDQTSEEQMAPQQPFPDAAYQDFTLLGQDLGAGTVASAQADAVALNQLTQPGLFNTILQDLSQGDLSAARQNYSVLQPLFSRLCNTSESHAVKLHILRVGTDGSSTDMVVKKWQYSLNTVYAPVPGDPRNFTRTQSGPVPDALPWSMITNADTGVVLSWSVDLRGYCAISTGNGCTGQVADSTEYHLATTAGTAPASDATYIIPGQMEPVTPMLQHEDGSFIGESFGLTGVFMVAFDSSANVKWSVPGYSPQIATADGGLIAGNAAFDANGNVTGLIANLSAGTVISWFGDRYAPLGSAAAKVAFPSVTLASSFAAILGGNPSANQAAVKQMWFPPLITCRDGLPGKPCPQTRELIYDAWSDLVAKLRINAGCRAAAQTFVFNKITDANGFPLTADTFLRYLTQVLPRFYDGTTSSYDFSKVLCGPRPGFTGFLKEDVICTFFGNAPGGSVADQFSSNQQPTAITQTPSFPLLAFIRPSEILPDNNGANLTNEAMIFHEALHGITGEEDNLLQGHLLGSGGVIAGGSSNISDYIRINVLTSCP